MGITLKYPMINIYFGSLPGIHTFTPPVLLIGWFRSTSDDPIMDVYFGSSALQNLGVSTFN
jgi:hypothetical protein